MKAQARRLWGWVQRHRVWSSIILLVLLACGGYWSVYLVRFGLPPPTGQNCGSLQHGSAFFAQDKDGTGRADSELRSLTCFWQAYHTCKAATIIQTLAGTDAGHTDTLTIEERNNRCVIYGNEDWQVNTEQGSATYLCTQLSRDGDNLQVSACDGIDSFDLFARDVISESYFCGIVGVWTSSTPKEMEACFFAAYQQCLAASMGYRIVMDGAWEERDFYIDNHCGIAYGPAIAPPYFRRPSDVAACANVTLRHDGLHFSQCGDDGDVFVPGTPQ
jgi:hypothetical protein